MTSLLLTQDHDPELTSNVVDFLLKLIENKTESTLVQQFSLDSLIEIELCYPVTKVHINYNFMYYSDIVISGNSCQERIYF